MPEESKKNQHKGAKDQRKPRNRNQAGSSDKRVERKAEEPKVPVHKPPVYEDPGPEFYKNLKRETDDILKITEEANSKYKKKEIQSNWSKYEMPIESYDEIEEQENMGADYEKLIEAPLSVGGHFQFKHEKSWDVDTGPSLYDKYFEVNMDNLFMSIGTIPFYERVHLDKGKFNESDILSMDNRATRFKQKYYNDKKFMTPELTVQDKIHKILKEDIIKEKDYDNDETENVKQTSVEMITKDNLIGDMAQIKLDNAVAISKTETEKIPSSNNVNKQIETPKQIKHGSKENIDHFDDFIVNQEVNKMPEELDIKDIVIPSTAQKVADQAKQSTSDTKNQLIESPEDLEKWLDDFLDG